MTGLTALSSTPCGVPPAGLILPYGYFSYSITGLNPSGSSATIVMILPAPAPTGVQYWKCQNGAWINVTSLLGDNDGDIVLTLTLTDGGLGDADGQANGTIVDPGGVAIPAGIGTLKIISYQDYDRNGNRGSSEPLLPGWSLTISGPEGYTASGVTDASGILTLPNLTAGNYTITEGYKAPENPAGAWFNTTANPRTVIVPGGGVGMVEFGNEYNPHVPASSQTGMYVMIGSFALMIGLFIFWKSRSQY